MTYFSHILPLYFFRPFCLKFHNVFISLLNVFGRVLSHFSPLLANIGGTLLVAQLVETPRYKPEGRGL
jgi:hypothetical protein